MNHYNIKKQISIDTNIHLYLLHIEENSSNINLDIIPRTQLVEISRYKVKRDRDKRLLARSFLYDFLSAEEGVANFEFDFNEYRKPFLNGAPDMQFSFSYAKEYVLVGISKYKKVGVDIEYIDPALEITDIAPEIMCKAELDQFISYPGNSLSRQLYFYKLFSAKESIIKAFGTGLYFNIKSINTIERPHCIYENVNFAYQELDTWMNQYTMAICYEQ